MVFSFLFSCYMIIVISFRLFWWAQLIKWFKRRKIILLWWLTDFIERLFAFIDSSGMNIAFLSNRNGRFSTGFQLSMCFSFSSSLSVCWIICCFSFHLNQHIFFYFSLFFRPCDSDGWNPSGEDNNNINNNKPRKKKWKKWSASKSHRLHNNNNKK